MLRRSGGKLWLRGRPRDLCLKTRTAEHAKGNSASGNRGHRVRTLTASFSYRPYLFYTFRAYPTRSRARNLRTKRREDATERRSRARRDSSAERWPGWGGLWSRANECFRSECRKVGELSGRRRGNEGRSRLAKRRPQPSFRRKTKHARSGAFCAFSRCQPLSLWLTVLVSPRP
jgi:hypothetical protein